MFRPQLQKNTSRVWCSSRALSYNILDSFPVSLRKSLGAPANLIVKSHPVCSDNAMVEIKWSW